VHPSIIGSHKTFSTHLLSLHCCPLNLFNFCRPSELWLVLKFSAFRIPYSVCVWRRWRDTNSSALTPFKFLGFQREPRTRNCPSPLLCGSGVPFNWHLQKCPVILASSFSPQKKHSTHCHVMSPFSFFAFILHAWFWPSSFLCHILYAISIRFVIIFKIRQALHVEWLSGGVESCILVCHWHQALWFPIISFFGRGIAAWIITMASLPGGRSWTQFVNTRNALDLIQIRWFFKLVARQWIEVN